MKTGDHIAVWRGVYIHHGIYAGDGRVIHYSGELGQKKEASVLEVSLERFADGGRVYVEHYSSAFSPWRVVERARERLGERRYSLVINNCEHFARWCRLGEHHSKQVQYAVSTGGQFVSRLLARLLSGKP